MNFELSEEQKMLKNLAREITDDYKPTIEERAKKGEPTSDEDLRQARKVLSHQGLLGMTIPPKYGGQGRPFLDMILVLEQLSRYCFLPYGYLVISTSSGPVSIIIAHGTEEQKKKYLPHLVKGDMGCAIGMTEAEAGSAVTDLTTSAVLDGDHYVLNGGKFFVGGGGFDELYLVYVRLNRIPGSRGVGSIIVEKGMPGFSFGQDFRFWGALWSSRRELVFQDCRVPKENLVTKAGQFPSLMGAFNCERVHNSAMTLGIAQGAFEEALRYSQERKQFGRLLCEFQMIQQMLADMAILVDSARLLVYRAASLVVDGTAPALESSIAKVFSSEMAIKVCDHAIQIHGAYGVTRDFLVSQLYQQARAFSIAVGTAQIQRIRIVSQLTGRSFSQR